jgi:hypothetical protein
MSITIWWTLYAQKMNEVKLAMKTWEKEDIGLNCKCFPKLKEMWQRKENEKCDWSR